METIRASLQAHPPTMQARRADEAVVAVVSVTSWPFIVCCSFPVRRMASDR
ncbi:MAG: hypothetical protein ACJ77F_02145 [Chloroflexota bacterium]